MPSFATVVATLFLTLPAISQDPATFSTFGTGCAGTGGTPTLDAAPGSLPWLGETFVLEIGSLRSGIISVPFGIIGLSDSFWETLELPRDLGIHGMPGCTQYVSIDFAFLLQNIGGTATWEIPVPNNEALIGFVFYTQTFSFDLARNFPWAVVSNGGRGVIGAR